MKDYKWKCVYFGSDWNEFHPEINQVTIHKIFNSNAIGKVYSTNNEIPF